MYEDHTVRFSLKSLAVAVMIIALILGWIVDHQRLKQQLDSALRQNWLTASNEERRMRIKGLANETRPDIPLLLFALSDPEYRVRDTALAALKRIPSTEYTDDPEANTEFERWLRIDRDQ